MIVSVLVGGLGEGLTWIALEAQDEGGRLRERVRDADREVRDAARDLQASASIRAVAEELASLHGHGTLASELQPENVVIADPGRPRLRPPRAHRLGEAPPSDLSPHPAEYRTPESP